MASVPLNPNPAVQELLSKLEPNVLPTEPSFWPLAPGYWLLLILFAASCIGVGIWFYRGRLWRQVKREQNRLKQLNDRQQQLLDAHKLLRWLCAHVAGQPAAMSDRDFQVFVSSMLGYQPVWLNQHYQNCEQSAIDWPELNTLIQHIKKRGAA